MYQKLVNGTDNNKNDLRETKEKDKYLTQISFYKINEFTLISN